MTKCADCKLRDRETYTTKSGNIKYQGYCSECRKIRDRKRADEQRKQDGKPADWHKPLYLLSPEEIDARRLRYKTKQDETNRANYKKNSAEYIQYQKEYRAKNKAMLRQKKREYEKNLKLDGIRAYGGKCSCCGESIPEFLTIDHINGRGDEKRRLTGTKMWMKLKSLGWPTDNFALLCFNCNCAKGAYGQCPHKKLEPSDA